MVFVFPISGHKPFQIKRKYLWMNLRIYEAKNKTSTQDFI